MLRDPRITHGTEIASLGPSPPTEHHERDRGGSGDYHQSDPRHRVVPLSSDSAAWLSHLASPLVPVVRMWTG
jgi:hypothetical protein